MAICCSIWTVKLRVVDSAMIATPSRETFGASALGSGTAVSAGASAGWGASVSSGLRSVFVVTVEAAAMPGAGWAVPVPTEPRLMRALFRRGDTSAFATTVGAATIASPGVLGAGLGSGLCGRSFGAVAAAAERGVIEAAGAGDKRCGAGAAASRVDDRPLRPVPGPRPVDPDAFLVSDDALEADDALDAEGPRLLSPVSADAMATLDITPVPTPKTTAKLPRRPTYFAALTVKSPTLVAT